MKRVFLFVLDSCGCGEMPDAAKFGDHGVNTLRSCSTSDKLNIPNLLAYGLAKPLAMRALSGMTVTVQENVAMLVGMCLFVGFNYLGQRFFVFRETSE